ncbi:MAG: hypothetical protein WCK02_12620 [Bacteroidota bacterium]
MKLNYVKNENIDKIRWDEVIANSFNGIVYAYSWYLDIIADNWDALIDENFEYVFPIVWRKKFGIKYIYQPYFTQQLGVFSTKIISSEIVALFCNSIPSEYKVVNQQLNTYNDLVDDNLKKKIRTTYQLDLILPFDLLQKSFSENNKRNYKRALKNNLFTVNTLVPEDLINLFQKDKLGQFRQTKPKDFNNLKNIMFTSKHKGIGQLWSVYSKEKVLLAGAYFIESNNKIIFLFSATNSKGREFGAMSFLLTEFIRLNAGRNITIDFEGSDVESVARFYKSFGAKKTEYISWFLNRLPFPLNILKTF